MAGTNDTSLHASWNLDAESLHMLATHTDTSIVFTDAERRITWVNPAFEKLTGYTLEGVRGRNPSLLQGAETDPEAILRIRKALNDGLRIKEEILNYSQEGRVYLIELEIIPRMNCRGVLIGFMAMQRDVTELRRYQKELEGLRIAVEQSDSVIVITDSKGMIEYVNPAFEKLTGYTHEEAFGKNPNLISSGEQSQQFYADLWAAISNGETWKGRFHNKRKDGSLFWEEATISPVMDEQGRLSRYIAVKEDITARIDAEKSLTKEHKKLTDILKAADQVSIIATDPQ